MKRQVSIKLTFDEYSVLLELLQSVRDCMEYDEDTQSYTDGGRFILSLDEEEYKALNSINLLQ